MAKKKFWNFINKQATETEPESVELRIDGEIVSSDDAWFYEWFGIPVASPNSFRSELNQYKGKDITVWIDSYGGDVFAGAGIYNALMEHKKSGGKVTCKIDGKAMSAASVISMAGDEILMSPVSIMMIHNPLSSVQGYASDMRKAADVLDTVKETIMNAYEAKTKRSREEISAMMDDESYMDCNKAIKEGFADGALYQEGSSNPQNIMNFSFDRMTILNCANASVKHLFELEKKIRNAQQCQCSGCSQTQEDCRCADCGLCNECCDNPQCCGCSCEQCSETTCQNKKNLNQEEKIMDLKELKNKYPDIYKAAYNEGSEAGAKTERERLQAIDEISNNVDPQLINEAKYVKPMDAKDLAMAIIKADGNKGNKYLDNLQDDTSKSGVENVGVAGNKPIDNDEGNDQAKVKNAASKIASYFRK